VGSCTAGELLHGHGQHPQNIGRDQTCRSGDILAEIQRDTQTY